MIKIKSIKFNTHPVLKDLFLDFSTTNNEVADTIIFAGENGSGKTTIINTLYDIIQGNNTGKFGNFTIELIIDDQEISLSYISEDNKYSRVYNKEGKLIGYSFENKTFKANNISAIYSDVDINFHSNQISSITSLALDINKESRKSTNNLPTEINQLLVDVQALDDAELSYLARQNPHLSFKDLKCEQRMSRFTRAFNKMFENLSYCRIENNNGKKDILFNKNGSEIPIEQLSSGEKQIIYRSSFLLRDSNATKGAFVFIDEPEISLHPRWQTKILNYYCDIFSDEKNQQTSQIFIVTHSPFIIHNDSRINDKVIILERDEDAKISTSSTKLYYKCNEVETIRSAFHINNFHEESPTAYVEGRTDEMYFNCAKQIFSIDTSINFKWIGSIKNGCKEENTGKDSLNRAVTFLKSHNPDNVCIFIYDCDCHKKTELIKNVLITQLDQIDGKPIKKGIENSLILDSIDMHSFYDTTLKADDYGGQVKKETLNKMKLCQHILSLSIDQKKSILENIKTKIESLEEIIRNINQQ